MFVQKYSKCSINSTPTLETDSVDLVLTDLPYETTNYSEYRK